MEELEKLGPVENFAAMIAIERMKSLIGQVMIGQVSASGGPLGGSWTPTPEPVSTE